MNTRYTVLVFLAFLVLAGVAYTMRDREPVDLGAGTATPTPAPLLELTGEDVQAVEVSGAEGDFTLTRVAGGWEVDGEPATDEVDLLVGRLATLESSQTLPPDRDPEVYGFAPPTLTVTLRSAAGEGHTLEIGDETPVGGGHYVRLAGSEQIVVVQSGDIGRLQTWLDEPPIAPTPTPEGADETAEAGADVEADAAADDGTEAAGPDEGDGAAEDADSTPEADEGGTAGPASEDEAGPSGDATDEGAPDETAVPEDDAAGDDDAGAGGQNEEATPTAPAATAAPTPAGDDG